MRVSPHPSPQREWLLDEIRSSLRGFPRCLCSPPTPDFGQFLLAHRRMTACARKNCPVAHATTPAHAENGFTHGNSKIIFVKKFFVRKNFSALYHAAETDLRRRDSVAVDNRPFRAVNLHLAAARIFSELLRDFFSFPLRVCEITGAVSIVT